MIDREELRRDGYALLRGAIAADKLDDLRSIRIRTTDRFDHAGAGNK